MGWWSLPEDSSVYLGDEVMDVTYTYLEQLVALYGEALQRKPTIRELQAVLRLALWVNGEKCVDDLAETRQVDAVAIKTSVRPKRQKYQVGDIFAIPIGQRHLFGRIINLDDGWDLIEVFTYSAKTPRYTPEITQAARLLPPLGINPRDLFGEWRWRIVRSEPGTAPSDVASLRYRMGTPGNYKWVKVNGFKPCGKLTDEEATCLPPWAIFSYETVLDMIKEAALEQKLL